MNVFHLAKYDASKLIVLIFSQPQQLDFWQPFSRRFANETFSTLWEK